MSRWMFALVGAVSAALLRPAQATALAPQSCEIRGSFLLPGGAPAAWAHYKIRGRERDDAFERRQDGYRRWSNLTGETDAEGRLEERFEPRGYEFTLEVKLRGHAGVKWSWEEIQAGKEIDLGAVGLVRGGSVEGRIVDRQGNPALGNRQVYARSLGQRAPDGREETEVRGEARDDGSFRLEDVMPGRVELEARGAEWTEKTIVEVRSGETASATLVTKPREATSRISLDASWWILSSVEAGREHVTLTGPDGAVRRPMASPFPFGSIVFAGLVEGEYRLAIDDPRFLPWSRTVRPGADVEAKLEGTSAIELRVRGADGRTIESFGLEVELRNVDFSPHTITSPRVTARDTLPGLVPGDYRLTVRGGGEIGWLDVDGLASGETRSVEVRLGPPRWVEGRLLFADGVPVREADVALFGPDGLEWPRLWMEGRPRFDPGVPHQVTEEDGAFRFAVARGGEYVVYACGSTGLQALSEPIVLEEGARERVDLVLPRGGFVAGRILASPGASVDRLRVGVGQEEGAWPNSSSVRESAREVDADGRFELGPLQPGPTSLYLLLPEYGRRLGRPGKDAWWNTSDGLESRVELGTIEVLDGARVERAFAVTELPGSAAFSVRVNGDALGGLLVELTSERDGRMQTVAGETDAQGRCAPILAFPGSWTVHVRDLDAGWRHVHPVPVQVTSSSETRAQIDVQVSEASLSFLDARTGAPLADRMISVLGPTGDPWATFSWQRKKTDAHGRASWTLASGEYRFRLDPEDDEFLFLFGDSPAEPARIAPLTWTAEGPRTSEVRL